MSDLIERLNRMADYFGGVGSHPEYDNGNSPALVTTLREAATALASEGEMVRLAIEEANKRLDHIDALSQTRSLEDVCIERDSARHQRDTVTRTLARYEHAFDNILTLIDGKVDTVDGERSDLDPPSANDYGQIQNEIDQARSGR